MQRDFPNLKSLRGKLAYHQHLSVSRYFLGKKKMGQLGLPEDISAWYPLLTAAPRFAQYMTQKSVPVLRARQQRIGRAQQKETLRQMFGKSEQAVGVNRGQSVSSKTAEA